MSQKMAVGGADEYICHTRVMASGLGVSAVVDPKYPTNSAMGAMTKALELFTAKYPESQWKNAAKTADLSVPGLSELVNQYYNEGNVDKVKAIQSDLDDTKGILENNINQLLDRGEKLETLEQTTITLETDAHVFRGQAEEMNMCCCCKCSCLANTCPGYCTKVPSCCEPIRVPCQNFCKACVIL